MQFSATKEEQFMSTYPLLLEEPVLFPELLLETTEMALAMASTADRRSAKVFLSDLSASEIKQFDHSDLQEKDRTPGHRLLNIKLFRPTPLICIYHFPLTKPQLNGCVCGGGGDFFAGVTLDTKAPQSGAERSARHFAALSRSHQT